MNQKLFKPKKKTKKAVIKKVGCEVCKLHEKCNSPKLPVYGKGAKKILILASSPTQREDEIGVPYQGETGKLLRKALLSTKINLKTDCWHVNGVRCYTKKVTNSNINMCRPLLLETIKELKPEKIIVLSKEALQSLLGDRTSITGITKWTGEAIPDQELKCWIFPLQDPIYIIKNKFNVMAEKFFKDELIAAVQHDKEFPDNIVKEEQLNLITSSYGACIYLEGLAKMPPEAITFDYETTGLKPHAKGHKILCVSFSYGDRATCFPIFPDKEFQRALRKIIGNPKIKKIAANIQFEDTWTKEILGYSVKNWHWDTMIGQHILNNRSGVSGLKFQTYIKYGILEYDKPVEKYIKSNDKSNNAFNKLEECPQVDLLTYCALDSLFTWDLYQDQLISLTDETGKIGFDLFMEGAVEFALTHQNGMCVDTDYYNKQNKILLRKMDRLSNKILTSEEVGKWNEEKEFNFNSDTMLRKLLFDILKYKPSKETAGGKASVDAEALNKLKDDIPILKYILQWKKLHKIQNTYLAGYLREEVDGVIHSNFMLHTTRSFRSSSANVNSQNVPKRELLAYKTVRTGVIPRPGNQLLEVDFSGAEVCISASYNQDPELVNYIIDPKTDMHRDVAVQIFKRKEKPEGDERFLAKNSFVFAQFYGDYYKSCAKSLWERMTDQSKEHLKEQKIKSYIQFENHIKAIEYDFWKKRFKVYDKWKTQTWNKYIQKKVIKSHTGFYYTGVMQKNDALNYAIQGSSFHVLLWAFIQISKYIKDNNMKTKIIGQIHDSIVFDVCPVELSILKPVIRKIMCEDTRKQFPFIKVPLNIDAEVSSIDGNWAEMKEE
ncbi:MAG: hypothetical protein GY870_22450, partial [archaeon]|nr:hypothetical protein [archaeon]